MWNKTWQKMAPCSNEAGNFLGSWGAAKPLISFKSELTRYTNFSLVRQNAKHTNMSFEIGSRLKSLCWPWGCTVFANVSGALQLTCEFRHKLPKFFKTLQQQKHPHHLTYKWNPEQCPTLKFWAHLHMILQLQKNLFAFLTAFLSNSA